MRSWGPGETRTCLHSSVFVKAWLTFLCEVYTPLTVTLYLRVSFVQIIPVHHSGADRVNDTYTLKEVPTRAP